MQGLLDENVGEKKVQFQPGFTTPFIGGSDVLHIEPKSCSWKLNSELCSIPKFAFNKQLPTLCFNQAFRDR